MDNQLYFSDPKKSFYGYLEVFTCLNKIISTTLNPQYSLEVEVEVIGNILDQEKIFNKDKKSAEFINSASIDPQIISHSVKILRVFEKSQKITFTVFEGSKNPFMNKKIFGSASTFVHKLCQKKAVNLDIFKEDRTKVAEILLKTIQTEDLKEKQISFQLRLYFETQQDYIIKGASIGLIGKSNVNTLEEMEVYQGEVISNVRDKQQVTIVHNVQKISAQHLYSCGENETTFKVILIMRGVNKKGDYLQGEYSFIANKTDLKATQKIQLNKEQIIEKKDNSFSLINFQYQFFNVSIEEQITFNDYVKSGINFNLIIGIDFSMSNGDPSQASSLHNTSPENLKKNPYVQAINIAGNFLMRYDSDKQVPVYGFSGQPILPHFKLQQTHDCFPIIGYKLYPELKNVNGILSGYFNIIDNKYVKLGGKTQLQPLINSVFNKATKGKNQSPRNYYILLIITDGVCHDLDSTIKQIKLCQDLPLSIIIVGVGNEDFEDMEYLNSSINDQSRDIVSFVKMSDFEEDNEEDFYSKIFHEVPGQVNNFGLFGEGAG